MMLSRSSKSTSSKYRISLSIFRAVAPSHNMLIERGYKSKYLLSIYQSHIGKAHVVLLPNESCKLLCLTLTFSKQQISTLAIVQIGFKLQLQCLQAFNSLNSQSCFNRMSSLPSN